MAQNQRKTPEQVNREVVHQLKYQQRKLVAQALTRSEYKTEAALVAEARRLFKMPMSELNKLMIGEDAALVGKLIKE